MVWGISLGGPWPLFGGLVQPTVMWVPCPGQAAPIICFPLVLDGPVENFQSQSWLMSPAAGSAGSGFGAPCPWAGVCALCRVAKAKGDLWPWMGLCRALCGVQ